MLPTEAQKQRPLPQRRAEDVIAAALADEELMAQLADSLEAERRGDPTIPFSQVRDEAQRRRSA